MSEYSSRRNLRVTEYNEAPTHRNTGSIIIMVVVGLGICVLLLYSYISKKSTYSSWEETAVYEAMNNGTCLRTDSGFVLYNRDGAEGHNSDGRIIWKISYNMSNPIGAVCGSCAAFADKGGQIVSVTDGSGANNTIAVPERIVEVCVAQNGITAVRTDAGEKDNIYLFDMSGELLLDICTEVRKSGFPITMALSMDGTKLVTSYLKADEEQESWVTFYNFGQVGYNYVDKMVGSFSYGAELIPDIRFLTNDRVAVTGKNDCTIYKYPEVPEQLTKLAFTDGIISISSHKDKMAIATRDTQGIYSVGLYDHDGKKTGGLETGVQFERIEISSGELVLLYDDSCTIYRSNGKEKFRSKFDERIKLIYLSSGSTEYTFVGEKTVKQVGLRTKND